MSNRIVHQKYLEAWLNGEVVEFQWCGQVFFDVFDINHPKHTLQLFADNRYMFRLKPKIVEINVTDFYAEYDKMLNTYKTEDFMLGIQDLVEKYLPKP